MKFGRQSKNNYPTGRSVPVHRCHNSSAQASLLICSLTSLAWGRSQFCSLSTPTESWISHEFSSRAEGMSFFCRPPTLSGLDVARVRHGSQVALSLLLQIQLVFLTAIAQNHQKTEVSCPQKSSPVPLWSLVSNFSLPGLYLHGFFTIGKSLISIKNSLFCIMESGSAFPIKL